MIKALTSPGIRLFAALVPCALLACAGGGSGGSGGSGQGTGGSSSGGSTGSGGNGSGGSATGGNGSGGNGSGGSASGGNGAGGNVSTGGVTGSGGSATGGNGSGGSATGGNGSGGVAGSGAGGTAGGGAGGSGTGGGTAGTSGFTPYACPSGMSSPAASAIPAGSAATRIAGAPPMDNFDGNQGNGFTNVEGPVWIGNALYFSEMLGSPNPPPSRILKIDSSDTVTQFYPSSGGGGDSGSNGMAVDSSGNLVTANHGVGGIVSFTVPGGVKTTLIDSFGTPAKRFNSPNDLTIRSDGTIYFTDPTFQTSSPTQPNTGVYMVPPKSPPTATEILSSVNGPNGITLSLDEKTLYVGSGSGVNAYAVNMDGTIATTATAIDGANLNNNNTDGMAIDCAGDLYVVRVNTKDIDVVGFGSAHPSPTAAGTHITTITGVPGGGQLTNLAFGGTTHTTLYITAQGTFGGSNPSKGVFKLTGMPVPGMPY